MRRKGYPKQGAIAVYLEQCRVMRVRPLKEVPELKKLSGNEVFILAQNHFKSCNKYKQTMWLAKCKYTFPNGTVIKKPNIFQRILWKIRNEGRIFAS